MQNSLSLLIIFGLLFFISTEVKANSKRLTGLCQDTFPLNLHQKKITDLPYANRVVILEEKKEETKVVSFHQGNLVLGWVSSNAISNIVTPCLISSEKSYINDLEFTLKLISDLGFNQAIEFKSIYEKTKLAYQSSKKKIHQYWKDLELYHQTHLILKEKNAIKKLATIQQLIFDVLNPDNIKNKTLFIPLSLPWLNSHPKLKLYYETQWESKFDNHLSGSSGEGVSNYGPDSQFHELIDHYLKLKTFLQKEVPSLLQTPEGLWLATMTKEKFYEYSRFIFTHEQTWNQNGQNLWADYIPIDQSLGLLSSDYHLSVLIHEVNVNSSNYLPFDTHDTKENVTLVLKEVQSKGLDALNAPDKTKSLFALNPSLTLFTIVHHLKFLQTLGKK